MFGLFAFVQFLWIVVSGLGGVQAGRMEKEDVMLVLSRGRESPFSGPDILEGEKM